MLLSGTLHKVLSKNKFIYQERKDSYKKGAISIRFMESANFGSKRLDLQIAFPKLRGILREAVQDGKDKELLELLQFLSDTSSKIQALAQLHKKFRTKVQSDSSDGPKPPDFTFQKHYISIALPVTSADSVSLLIVFNNAGDADVHSKKHNEKYFHSKIPDPFHALLHPPAPIIPPDTAITIWNKYLSVELGTILKLGPARAQLVEYPITLEFGEYIRIKSDWVDITKLTEITKAVSKLQDIYKQDYKTLQEQQASKVETHITLV